MAKAAATTPGDSGKTVTPKTPKQRSPNYPLFGLADALKKVEAIYTKHKRFPIPLATAASLWGYESITGTANQCIGALRSYGLLEVVEGSGDARKVRISDRAEKIVAGHPDRIKLLREAALGPKIYSELWAKFHTPGEGLHPDESIQHYLRWDREEGKFNAQAIGPLIDDFKATVALAKLDSSATIPEEDTETEGDFGDSEEPEVVVDEIKKEKTGQSEKPQAGMFPLPVLMDDGTFRLIHIPPLTERAFQFFKGALDTYKPAIVLAQPKPAENA